MARNQKNAKRSPKRTRDERSPVLARAEAYVKKEPVEYGKPFIVMEDSAKNTFAYDGAAWNPFHLSIADCQSNCLVKMLPQKVNGKTRYEVRAPISRA